MEDFTSSEILSIFNNLHTKKYYIENHKLPIKNPKEILNTLNDFKGNSIIRKLIILFSNSIKVVRGIRGDGNCFYRAFAFNYIELIINYNLTQRKKFLLNFLTEHPNCMKICGEKLENIDIDLNNLNLKIHEFLFFLFNKTEEISNDSGIGEKLQEIHNKIEFYDVGIILLFRAILYQGLIEKKKNKEEDSFGVLDFIFEEIKIYGNEAEQPMIHLLSECLQVVFKFIKK